MKCARCDRGADEHPEGRCPDGNGSFEFTINPDAIAFVRDNPDKTTRELADLWIERVLERDRARLETVIVPVTFPRGEILDRDGIVWQILSPGTAIASSRLLGTCSGDPASLVLSQVTVEQFVHDDLTRRLWRLDLISPGQTVPFPSGKAFELAVVGLERHQVRAESTVEAPVRITVHVRRRRPLLYPTMSAIDRPILDVPITFDLTLLARGVAP